MFFRYSEDGLNLFLSTALYHVTCFDLGWPKSVFRDWIFVLLGSILILIQWNLRNVSVFQNLKVLNFFYLKNNFFMVYCGRVKISFGSPPKNHMLGLNKFVVFEDHYFRRNQNHSKSDLNLNHSACTIVYDSIR